MSWLLNKDGERRTQFVTPDECERKVEKTAAFEPKRELPNEVKTRRVLRLDDPEGEAGVKQAGDVDVQVVCANQGARDVFERLVEQEARNRRGRGLLDGE